MLASMRPALWRYLRVLGADNAAADDLGRSGAGALGGRIRLSLHQEEMVVRR